MPKFRNRSEAGQRLAQDLQPYADREDVVVLGLPRGGVPVAYQVAEALNAPLDVFLVRKLGAPGQPELAMGAIASGGVRVLNQGVVQGLNVSQRQVERVTEREREELERRERAYRGARKRLELKGRIVILVDDGLATGASMRAAVQAVRAQEPAKIVVAVPTGAPQTCRAFEREVDEVVCVLTPQPFMGVGAWYRDFSQTTNDEVRSLLQESRAHGEA